MRFWDASAVVPLVLEQSRSDYTQGLIDEEPLMIVWWGTRVEFTSALCRLEREARLAAGDVEAALDGLRWLAERWYEVQPTVRLRRTAERLLRVHRLRAADGLQLAAACIAADGDPETVAFVSFDAHLNRAAGREGFRVLSGR